MTKRSSNQPALLVLDAQAVWLRAVETIAAEAGFAVTTTGSLIEALRLLPGGGFDVLLAGTDTAVDLSWTQLLARARKLAPATRLILVGEEEDPDVVRQALEAGADAYVTRRVEPDDLVFAIRQVLAPALYLEWPFSRGRGLAERGARPRFGLTRREDEVLRLIARGRSNAEIAHELGITEQTVKGHLWRLYRKLGVSNRTAAARWAERAGHDPGGLPLERG